jgi:hypothetical protein
MAGLITAAPRLSQPSRVIGFNTRLQAMSNIADIYTDLMGLYNRKNESFPKDAIRMRVTDQDKSVGTITLKDKLSLPGVYGNTPALGTEEPPRTYHLNTYQNNWRKVIPKPGYGLRKLEADNYRLYEEHQDDLADWSKEEHGYCIRRALLERYSPNLLQGDTAAQCVPWWNPNIFIPTLGLYNQPAFNRNRAIHTNNICNALMQSGGFGQLAARTLTAPVLDDMSNWALRRRIRPLRIPGLPTGEGYLLTISEIQAALVSNATWAANNLGALYVAKAALPDMVQKWRGVIGSYGNILIVTDPRIPTVLPSGSAAPYSLQAGYMVWNSRDLRHRQNPNCKDVAFLHGAGAFWEVEGEKQHFITDDRDYMFHKGLGIAGVRGQGLPIFLDTNTNRVYNLTSAACLLDFPNGGSVAGI